MQRYSQRVGLFDLSHTLLEGMLGFEHPPAGLRDVLDLLLNRYLAPSTVYALTLANKYHCELVRQLWRRERKSELSALRRCVDSWTVSVTGCIARRLLQPQQLLHVAREVLALPPPPFLPRPGALSSPTEAECNRDVIVVYQNTVQPPPGLVSLLQFHGFNILKPCPTRAVCFTNEVLLQKIPKLHQVMLA